MAIKRKDFQKTSSTILEFLLKLPDEETSSRLRDTLLHGLHFLQQYYLILQKRDKEQKPLQWTIERGLSPLTPFREAPDKFEWPWIDVESNKVKQTVPKHSLNSFVNLPSIVIAVREGDLRYVKELLNSEPELIDCADSFGRDLLTYAVQYQQINILNYLLNECKLHININVQANDGSTCLHRACYSGDGQHCNIEIVRILLENHADVSKQDVHLRSPLHWAVLTENIDCLQLLIKYNGDIHIKDIDGMTPAMWACHLDRYDHFKELFRHMNNIEERDNDGRTWIHHSARKTEPLKCLKHLLTADSILLRDNDGKTCLHVAAEQGAVHACRLILDMSEQAQKKSYIHIGDNSRQTPLHLATKHGHARVLKELLEHGADPHLKDIQGISAIDYAQNRGLYFCRSVFEVYLREKSNDNLNSRPSTTLSSHNNNNNNNNIVNKKQNGHDITPTPPMNGQAKFIRRTGFRISNETTSKTNNSSSNKINGNDADENDLNRESCQISLSTTNSSLSAPPVKPRKSSTISNNSIINLSKLQQNQHSLTNSDSDDEANSLRGHRDQSDSNDEDQTPHHERPTSRLSLRSDDEQNPQQIHQVNNNNRQNSKSLKQTHRHSTYDEFRYVDEQQTTSPNKSKQQLRPSTHRIGSSNGYLSASNKLKSSSTESIPTLDLTVAGQKLFRTKQHSDTQMNNLVIQTNSIRPPSGRLKPLNSAKSTSSFVDEYPSISTKTLEDVTNNVKQPQMKAHLYKKKLAPLVHGNDFFNKKNTYRPSNEQYQIFIDDAPSDKSEETSATTSTTGTNREKKSSSNSPDKRSKYH